jgi:glycosyltransferase involved in cell wall biosynthesis|tara:strand:- start:362 stop:1060 length:699 start_codon:yes stop_codon:yes gene_type:complete
MQKIGVIIPAYNEALSIKKVITKIPSLADEILVINNGSTDETQIKAISAGATVLNEPKKGYGHACLCGINYFNNLTEPPEIIVFLDGDYSDYPEDLNEIIKPILEDQIDFVVGSRVKSKRERGSMTPQQIFGNELASVLIRILYGGNFSDLGPFRAIKLEVLNKLEMQDKTYGWTVEMQLKILGNKFSYCEVPVRYKKRIGKSKVSGTLVGTVMATIKILGWIFKYYFKNGK